MRATNIGMARWFFVAALLFSGCGRAVTPVVPGASPVDATQTVVATARPTRPPSAIALTPSAPDRHPSAPDAPTPQVAAAPSDWPTCWELLPGAELRGQAADLWEAGEYEQLTSLLQGARATAGNKDAAALDMCLARTALADGDLAGGAAQLLPWAQVAGPLQAEALAMLMNAYQEAGEWAAMVNTGEMLLALNPPGATQVTWRLALALVQIKEPLRALALLQELDVSDLPPGLRAEVLEELARLAREHNRWELALASLDEIHSFAQQPIYRALIQVERARTLVTISESDDAITLLNQVLAEQSGSIAGQQAIEVLKQIAAEDPELKEAKVHPMYEARALLYSGQHQGALNAAKKSVDYRDVDLAEAYTIKGLALEAQGNRRLALADFDRAITIYNQRKDATDELTAERVAEVYFAKAETVQALEGDPTKVYALFATRYPDHAQAPRALLLAAGYLDEAATPARAAAAYEKVLAAYPASAEAAEAAFLAGLAWYRAADLPQAQVAWQSGLEKLLVQVGVGAVTAADLARLEVWAGLALRSEGDLTGAQALWQAANDRDPNGYWGLRASDLNAGVALELPPAPEPLPEAVATDWEAIADWQSSWDKAPVADADAALVAAGIWLWRVGWETEAVELLGGLLNQRRDEPPLLTVLGRASETEGIWQLSTLAAERLMQAGQANGAPEPPEDLWRVAFPLPYRELVQAQATQYGLDPLLFMALLRQESRFYARAESWAGARGLGQVMPPTGAWIAEKIGPVNYRDALLYRPSVSVRYSAWYLDYTLGLRAGDWPAALVGYNAGPGNLAVWTNGEPVTDYDLFVATLPATEPLAYVTSIYRQYRLYQRLYQ